MLNFSVEIICRMVRGAGRWKENRGKQIEAFNKSNSWNAGGSPFNNGCSTKIPEARMLLYSDNYQQRLIKDIVSCFL